MVIGDPDVVFLWAQMTLVHAYCLKINKEDFDADFLNDKSEKDLSEIIKNTFCNLSIQRNVTEEEKERFVASIIKKAFEIINQQ